MIKQAMVPPIAGGNEKKFLETLSECLQGVMQNHSRKTADGGMLDIRAFGPLVFVRYEGKAVEVSLGFKPDNDMPLLCSSGDGKILAEASIMEFYTEGSKIAWGWCISGGEQAGRFRL